MWIWTDETEPQVVNLSDATSLFIVQVVEHARPVMKYEIKARFPGGWDVKLASFEADMQPGGILPSEDVLKGLKSRATLVLQKILVQMGVEPKPLPEL